MNTPDPEAIADRLFTNLRSLPVRDAMVALAITCVRFYEEAYDLGSVESYSSNLADIIVDEYRATHGPSQ